MGADKPKPIPFAEEMAPGDLRAAYRNYHDARKVLDRLLDQVALEAGRVAEAAAQVVQHGGEI